YRWVLNRGAPRYGTEGDFLGYVGSCIDIEDRRRDRDNLRESEALYRTLAEAMPQIVWTARPDGVIDWVNERWYAYTGRAPDEDPGAAWAAHLHPEDADAARGRWEECVRAAAPYSVEHRYRRGDGSYGWHLSRALPVRDERGRVLKWVGTSTDI